MANKRGLASTFWRRSARLCTADLSGRVRSGADGSRAKSCEYRSSSLHIRRNYSCTLLLSRYKHLGQSYIQLHIRRDTPRWHRSLHWTFTMLSTNGRILYFLASPFGCRQQQVCDLLAVCVSLLECNIFTTLEASVEGLSFVPPFSLFHFPLDIQTHTCHYPCPLSISISP